MKYEAFNQQVIELVGGKDNIENVAHCMTRLRFRLKDKTKAKTKEIQELEGVIDVVSNEVAYQIIIGTHVSDIHAELVTMLGLKGDGPQEKSKKNPFKAVLTVVSETMSPVIEPIIAAGLLAGLLSIVALTGVISTESSTYILLDSIRVAVFHFLPVFVAMSCAKRLNASPYIAVALAVTLLSASVDGVEGLAIFGIGLPAISYANSLIPIMLAVWFMGHVTTLLKKVLPQFLHYFLVPVLTLVICLPITLLFFGPIGIWIGEALTIGSNFLMNTLGAWSVVALYAALQPFLIMLGAGNFSMPIIVNFLAEQGFDPIFTHAATISDIAVCGAMFGYFFRTKKTKQKQLFGTVSFSALMGVTEPAIYGVFVKFRRPFIAVMVGGGLGGLFAGIMGVKSYSMAWGLAGLPAYIGSNDFRNFYMMIASVVISFAGAFAASYILGIPKEEEPEEETVKEKRINKVPLGSVAEGQVVQLSEVKDKAFSTGAMGKGIAIHPSGSEVYAPVDGKVTVVFPTKHAYGIVTEEGIEILIHIGIDTVELDGKYFEALVEPGTEVKKGQLLANIEVEKIKAAGYDPTIIVVITNTQDHLDVIPAATEHVAVSDECLTVVL